MTTTRPVRGKLAGRVVLVGTATCLGTDCEWSFLGEAGDMTTPNREAEKHTADGHPTHVRWRPE